MPEIPKIQRQVMPQVEQSLRLDPGSAGRVYDVDYSRANQATAQGLQNLSRGVMQLAEFREDTEVTSRMNKLAEDIQNFQYNKDTGILTTTQEDGASGVGERTETYIKKQRDGYLKGLSRNAQAKFVASTNSMALGAQRASLQHEATEFNKYRDKQVNITADNVGRMLANLPLDAENERAALDILFAANAKIYDGIENDETRKTYLDNMMKQAYSRALEYTIQDNPGMAREFLKQNKDMFTDNEYGVLLDETNRKVVNYEADQWAESFISEKGWRNALNPGNTYIEDNIDYGFRNNYRQALAEKINRDQNVYNQQKGQIYQTAVDAIYFQSPNKARQEVSNAISFLRKNGESSTAAQLQNMLKDKLKPAAVSYNIAQKQGFMINVLQKFRSGEFSREGAGSTYEQAYMYYTSGAGRGQLPAELFGEIAEAESRWKQENQRTKGRDPLGGTTWGKTVDSAIRNNYPDIVDQAEITEILTQTGIGIIEKNPEITDRDLAMSLRKELTQFKVTSIAPRRGIFGGTTGGTATIPEVEIRRIENRSGLKYSNELGMFVDATGTSGYIYDPTDPYRVNLQPKPMKKSLDKRSLSDVKAGKKSAANLIENVDMTTGTDFSNMLMP